MKAVGMVVPFLTLKVKDYFKPQNPDEAAHEQSYESLEVNKGSLDSVIPD